MKTFGLWLISLLVFLGSAAAWAQDDFQDERVRDKNYRSPQNYLFELKFGPYAPDIDSEFSNTSGQAHPYQHIFGDSQALMINGELDWEIWRPFGTIALGGSIGYYTNSVNAFVDDTTDNNTSSSSTVRSASSTSISLIPFSILAIYRFDVLAEHFKIPLVPYAKIGLNYNLWWIDIDGETANYQGQKGSGGTMGWQFNAGVSLLLDCFDTQAAKNLDVDYGINHTYIFFEAAVVRANGLYRDNALHVGDTTWNGGIAFEF